MATRALIAVSILCLLNFYVVFRVVGRWPAASQHLGWVIGGAILFVLLQLLAPFGDRLFYPALREKFGHLAVLGYLDWVSYMALGILSCLFIYSLFIDVVGLAWLYIAMPPGTVDLDRRALLTLGAVTAGSALVGGFQAASGPLVRQVEIPLPNLPKAFDGFKIVQISDLHVSGIIGKDYVENVVALANEQKPDLVALTGDFIDGSVTDLASDVAPLAKLRAAEGVFYITGNHEYYWGAPQWIAHFKTLGADPLLNEHRLIGRDGSQFVLGGVSDYSTLHMRNDDSCSPAKAFAGAPDGLVKVLLAHQPVTYALAHAAGTDLQLSGHTHAGQYFPFSLFIGFFQKYYKGLNRHENMWVYVNRGTGFWGPPLRTAVPSEITSITLRSV